MDITDLMVPVCALCRDVVLEVGVRVTIFHPQDYRDYLAGTDRPDIPPEAHDDPVVVCIPCGKRITTWKQQTRVQ